MRLTMIREDGFVCIDGRALSVDLNDMPADLHALQWNETEGHVERQGWPNQPIDSLADFQTWINRWHAKAAEIDNPPPAPAPTQDEIIQGYKDAIQRLLDTYAREKGYDDIVSACSYAGYANAFQAEAISFGVWRSEVWAYGYAELAKVIAGTRTVPTIEQILSELPTRVLP